MGKQLTLKIIYRGVYLLLLLVVVVLVIVKDRTIISNCKTIFFVQSLVLNVSNSFLKALIKIRARFRVIADWIYWELNTVKISDRKLFAWLRSQAKPEWPHRQDGCLTCCGCTFESRWYTMHEALRGNCPWGWGVRPVNWIYRFWRHCP